MNPPRVVLVGVPGEPLVMEGGVPSQLMSDTTMISYACIAQVQFAVLTFTSQCSCCSSPVTLTSTITHASPLLVSTGDGWCEPRDTAVGGYVGVRVVRDPSIRVSEGSQCGAGSCVGWELVLDRENIVSTH